mmetsp:Transcript_29144/g.64259  ORF Transcript_29144/g.64259 Transcript_29144/m.64259 type:complete len:156 (+) Transcript_29144:181-648(+)
MEYDVHAVSLCLLSCLPLSVHLHRGIQRATMGRGPNWSADEYEALAKAFKQVGGDPIKGASQRKSQYYERLHRAFKMNCQKSKALSSDSNWSDRSKKACKTEWDKAKLDIGKFINCLGKVYAMEPTGNPSEDNMINMAIAIHLGETATPRYSDFE